MARTPLRAYDPDLSPSSVPTGAEPDALCVSPDALTLAAAFPGYEFVRELGRGGMGVVYLARNRDLDRFEAVKVMTRPFADDRFQQEVRVAARLRHPNVVTVYAALARGEFLAFAMEYVEGETLARLVRRRGPLSPATACSYVRQAALALQHAHELGMAHRDIKPQNLMLCRENGRDVLKVLDFGLAKVSPVDDERSTVTLDGQVLGTPGYMAPEQVRDTSGVDVRADIYSLGVTLWFLLTGQPPVGGSRACAEVGGVPDGLAAVLARMTAWNPADRYQTPAEAADALEPFIETADLTPAPSGPPRRRWWLFGGWACLLVTVLVALLISELAPPRQPGPGISPNADPQPVADAPFVPIFNGADLSGWVVDGGPADQWRVEDGALVTTGLPNGKRTWLLTKRDYGDVRVRFEYRLDPGGNSGFVFRAVPGERPVLKSGGLPTPGPYHQQMELTDPTTHEWDWLPTGQISGGSGKNAPVLKPTFPARLKPPNDWNAVEIELVGQSFKMALNGGVVQAADLGDLVAMGSLYPALSRSRGRIGFQQFMKSARFRRIEVLELPPQPTPAGG